MNGQANASAKSKEVQPTAQSQRIAPHLLLPQPHDKQEQNLINLTTTRQNEDKKC
ncbi:hypothetical protein [Kaistella daneshvariae]|uniref:hypothetical protein n=1 Tax=Kaistella daneshvariae TaxID=2487074 RepID=UPI0013DE03EE|nr:hypothetical protein [Kaistella daneshvariae]